MSSINSIKYINSYAQTNKVQNVQNVSTPTPKAQQVDSVSFSKSNKVKSASLGLIGSGILVTGASIGATLMALKKINSRCFKKLAPKIEYKEAKTLQEAKEYAKNHLQIRKIEGFKEEDLDFLNWINEGLTYLSNKKNGEVLMPNKIKMTDIIKGKTMLDGTLTEIAGQMGGFFGGDTLTLSKKALHKRRKEEIDILKLYSEYCKNDPEKMNYKTIHSTVTKIIKDRKIKPSDLDITTNNFDIVLHEMGHLYHHKHATKLYENLNLGRESLTKKYQSEDVKQALRAIDLFNTSKGITSKMSKYAQNSPQEFVAEVFSATMAGIKMPDDILDLYKKLGGADLV